MKYEYWFAKIQGINLRKKIRLRQCMKTAEAIYYIEETQLKKIEFLNESEQDKILKAKRQDPEGCLLHKVHKDNPKSVLIFPDIHP